MIVGVAPGDETARAVGCLGQQSSSARKRLVLISHQTTKIEDVTVHEITTTDWVILSACNTAAGEAKGAEALSGLARAFFYAGAFAVGVAFGGCVGLHREAHNQRGR
jgi:hypothetical protein